MIRCEAFEFKQGKDNFYLGLIKAKEILSDCEVDVYDAKENPDGYQRRAQLQRAKRFSGYLTKCKGTFDSTCFLNVREAKEACFEETKKISAILRLGVLEINKSLYIVDGQHRIKGLELALEEKFNKDFLVPVLITIGNKKPDEALSFLIINRTAKGIRADLTDELIYKTIEPKKLTDDLKSVLELITQRNIGEFALSVTKRMNEDRDSFWAGKMVRPNEGRTADKTVNQRVFAQSLSDAIKSCSTLKRAANIGEVDFVTNWLKNYWQAIARVCPQACSPKYWRDYTLLKRSGVTVMNQLSGRILDDTGKEPAIENICQSLKKINSLDDENWHKNGSFGKLGTSFTALKNIYSQLELELDTASVLL